MGGTDDSRMFTRWIAPNGLLLKIAVNFPMTKMDVAEWISLLKKKSKFIEENGGAVTKRVTMNSKINRNPRSW